MAGGLKKDVELIFRGTDRATPTIKGVRDSVSSLTQTVRDQIAAAEKGEGSIDDLAKAYKALQAAQGDVTDIAKLATAYEKLGQKHAEAAVQAEEARQKEAQLAAQIEAAEKPTQRLIQKRETAGRQAAAAAAKEAELAAAVKLAGEAFEQAGGDASRFEASQEAIRAAALETARALTEAGKAMDGYKAAQGRGADAKAAIDEANRFNAQAAGSGLPQAQIDFISGLENRIEALSAAMRENETSAAAMAAAQQRIADGNTRARVVAFGQALDEAEDKARRFNEAMAMKAVASDTEARARDVQRFGANADTASAQASRFADAIQNIIAPTNAAARTLDGLDEIITKAEGSLDGSKRRMSEYNAEINNLAAANAGLADVARSVDAFQNQAAAVDRARAAFDTAQAEVLQFAGAIKQADEPTKEMVTALSQAEGKLETAGAALQRETGRLAQLEAKLESAGVDTRNLALAQDKLTAAATRAANAQKQLQDKTGGKGAFLGLNPNEMQNLGFQINDIFVSLASGQKPLTVLTQQGAQIAQIFPGAFSAIAAYLPILALVAAGLTPIIMAMKEIADEGARLENARATLAGMGDVAAGINVGTLSTLAEYMDQIGFSAEEATSALRQMTADGLDPVAMQNMIVAAKELSDATGVELVDALETVQQAFGGSFEQILELQAATNTFTADELKLIETLYEQGRADEARAAALEIYTEKQRESAAHMDGPWSRAFENIGAATRNASGWLAENSLQVKKLMADWAALGAMVEWVSGLLGKPSGPPLGRGGQDRLGGSTLLGGLEGVRRMTGGRGSTTPGGQAAIRAEEDSLRRARAVTTEQRRTLAVEDARRRAQAKGARDWEADQAARIAGAKFDAEQAKKDQKSGAAASKRAEAASRRRAKAAETAARQIASAEEQLQRQLEQLDSTVARQQGETLDSRLSGIDSQYEKLFRSIDEYSKKTGGRGLIGDKTIQQARDHVAAQKEILRNYVKMDDAEDNINDLLKLRDDKLDAIADKVRRGIITPQDGLVQSEAVIDDMAAQVARMAADALSFAQGLRTAELNPTLEAYIAKLEAAYQNNSSEQNVAAKDDVARDMVDGAQGNLNKIISDRNALIERENMLVAMGLQTYSDAQAKIQGFYTDTSGMIQKQIDVILDLASGFKSGTAEQQLFYNALVANLQNVALEAQGTDASFVNLKSQIDNLLTTEIVQFIDSVASAFADMVTGNAGVLDFFAAIGRALLQMIANILKTVATLIIQALILDAVDKMTGGILKPLLKLTAAAVSIHHEGGLAGSGDRSRNVSPLVFANAPRYHSGGVAGLQPNEVAAVLKKNEEVLTEDDPRHRFNGGLTPNASGGPGKLQKAVLAVGDEQIAAAMAGSAGEDVTLFHLRRNKAAVKQMLDN